MTLILSVFKFQATFLLQHKTFRALQLVVTTTEVYCSRF